MEDNNNNSNVSMGEMMDMFKKLVIRMDKLENKDKSNPSTPSSKNEQNDNVNVELEFDESETPFKSFRDIRKSDPRRESIYLDAAKATAKMDVNKSEAVIFKMHTSQSYNLRLNELSVYSIVNFLTQHSELERTEGVEIPISTLMSNGVRDTVVSYIIHKYGEEQIAKVLYGNVLHVDNITMKGYLQEYVRPRTTTKYIELLVNNLYFPQLPENYNGPTLFNFEIFFRALLKYRYRFMTLYEFISCKVPRDFIPDLYSNDSSRKGLIKIFLEPIPTDFVKKIVDNMGKHQFDKIETFLKVLYSRIEDTKQEFQDAADKSKWLTTGNSVVRHHDRSKTTNGDKSKPFSNNKDQSYVRRAGQQRVTTLRFDDDDYEDEVNLTEDDEADVNVTGNERLDNVNVSATSVNVLDNVDDTNSQLMACYSKALHGKCKFGEPSCKYKHDTATLQTLCARMLKVWTLSPYNTKRITYADREKDTNKVMGNREIKLHRPNTGDVHDDQRKLYMVSAYKAGTSDSEPEEMFSSATMRHLRMDTIDTAEDSSLVEVDIVTLKETLQAALPTTVTFVPSIAHKKGKVIMPDKTKAYINNILFDTGATHASYIGKHIIEAHKSVLDKYMISAKQHVRLGDGSTTIKIDNAIELVVEFVDSFSQVHIGKTKFYIMDMNGLDMIIGLPDIMKTYFSFFMDLLLAGKESLSQPASADTMRLATLMEPWDQLQEPAVEEVSAPEPSSFGDVLQFINKTHEEALTEYKELISTHVSSDMVDACPALLEFLQSDEALSVFVPREWKGLKIPPIELDFIEDKLPLRTKVRARPVNPRLLETARTEFKRLCGYLLVPSESSIASPIVVAPKATKPFIRLCGDYKAINDFIRIPAHPIPQVKYTLYQLQDCKYFVDIDMKNSFHQLPLAEKTSDRLSWITPWGLVKPTLLPEGVGPASGLLQRTVADIFSIFPWVIVIFDNILIGATTYEELFARFKLLIARAATYNLIFNFGKTFVGFTSVQFFGYRVSQGHYELTDDRRSAIMAIPMPTSQKQMQRFLGAALFFQPFIPHYSTLTAPLHDMVKASFNWDPTTWTVDYAACVDELKTALLTSVTLYFPDYTLQLVVRADASNTSCGAVLFQEVPQPDGTILHQPIAFASQKFSPTALKWDAFKKEAYALYYAVHTFEYYLRGSFFLLETDHRNLVWLSKSEIPIVIRWRIYLQSFHFLLRHIPGSQNTVADWMSRLAAFSPVTDFLGCLLSTDPHMQLIAVTNQEEEKDQNRDTEPEQPIDKLKEMLNKVHGGRKLHMGIRATYLRLNEEYPGHAIPYAVVADFVATCPICQKYRLGLTDTLQPLARNLIASHARKRIGIDRVAVTPPDDSGNCNCIVLVEHYTKYTYVYPSKDYTAESCATALFQYFATNGIFEEIISDPGSDFTSQVVANLHQWYGVTALFSIVDRHESNGVENTNGRILRHLRTLVQDERLVDKWSLPTVLPLIIYHLNCGVNHETGFTPIELKFGTIDKVYMTLPEIDSPAIQGSKLLQQLNENLKAVREASLKHQEEVVQLRAGGQSENKPVNLYAKGDFVLFDNEIYGEGKLRSRFLGPYRVMKHKNNNVTVADLINGKELVFHSSRCKVFYGTAEEAYNLAMRDKDQFKVDCISNYKGDPLKRNSLTFQVQFEDGSVHWVPFSLDIYATVQFEEFCKQRKELAILLMKADSVRKYISEVNKEDISLVSPGDTVYVDIRSYGYGWYDNLDLPEKYEKVYVVEYKYLDWYKQGSKKGINAYVPIFKETFKNLKQYFVLTYGSEKVFDTDKMRIVDKAFIKKYPKVLG